jgi:tol-pal system protein YbgF
VIRSPTIVGLLLAVAGPLAAASKDIERLQLQLANLEGQVAELKREADDSLKELRRLNESLADQNASLKKTVQDQRVQQESLQTALRDVGERLGVLAERFQTLQPPPISYAAPSPGAPGPSVGPSPGIPANPPPAGSPAPRELYSQAYADYARGNYDLAIQGFQEYLKNYPSTDFSDNAQYWIGECLYGKQRYVDALDAWKKLIHDFPSSDKLPDAHYKMGVTLERLGRRSQALIEYRYVVDRYPNSEAGHRARDKLNPQ